MCNNCMYYYARSRHVPLVTRSGYLASRRRSSRETPATSGSRPSVQCLVIACLFIFLPDFQEHGSWVELITKQSWRLENKPAFTDSCAKVNALLFDEREITVLYLFCSKDEEAERYMTRTFIVCLLTRRKEHVTAVRNLAKEDDEEKVHEVKCASTKSKNKYRPKKCGDLKSKVVIGKEYRM